MKSKIKWLSAFLFPLCFFVGCVHVASDSNPAVQSVVSEAPVPKLPPMNTQEKIQAAHHWGLIAQHIAGLVKRDLAAGKAQPFSAIYVAPSGVTPFEKVFHTFLITELVEEGLTVSSDPRGSLVLSFDIELITHPHRVIGIDSSVYNTLGPGLVVKPEASRYDTRLDTAVDYQVSKRTRALEKGDDYIFTLPRNEVIITTSLKQNECYIMRNSSIYYIDDPEWWQYAQKAKMDHPSLVNYTITDQ